MHDFIPLIIQISEYRVDNREAFEDFVQDSVKIRRNRLNPSLYKFWTLLVISLSHVFQLPALFNNFLEW